jgi:MATE family multidrug resistance protein
VGAGQPELIRRDFQQGIWLALMLGAIGLALLSAPKFLLTWADAPPEVCDKAIQYLRAIACGVPLVLLYRVGSSLLAATHHQRVIMWVSLAGVIANIPLNHLLIHGADTLPPLGAAGCGIATTLATLLNVLLATRHLARHPEFKCMALFQQWRGPCWAEQIQIIKLGLPIAFSLLVEISAFTLIALFVARLGPTVIGGHRIAGQLAGLCYMLPLALGTATSILVGQACGAGDYTRARTHAFTGTWLAGALASLVGLIIYVAREPISHAFTNDAAVIEIANQLLVFIALYQFFDGVQTIGTFALRGYRVTLAPLWIHILCFWVIGLAGGYWLAFYPVRIFGEDIGASGASGFWAAVVISTIAAALMLGALLNKVSTEKKREFTARQAND